MPCPGAWTQTVLKVGAGADSLTGLIEGHATLTIRGGQARLCRERPKFKRVQKREREPTNSLTTESNLLGSVGGGGRLGVQRRASFDDNDQYERLFANRLNQLEQFE